jgi:hypothetical protein
VPLQNRVTPLGDLVAHPARGLVYGNRGCPDERGRIRRRYDGKRWIACQLEFRGWRRERLLQPGKYTELFFLDEATAFAAGHRPCAVCLREDSIQRRLAPTLTSAICRTGAFVPLAGELWLVRDTALRRWTPASYAEWRPRSHTARARLGNPGLA